MALTQERYLVTHPINCSLKNNAIARGNDGTILFMLERVGLIIVFAFLMSRWRLFREMLFQEQGMKEKLWLVIIFSALSIVSSYTGIKIESGTIHPLNQMIHSTINAEEAIANTRLIGVAIAGIFGGPFVGVCVGIIAGIHRITLGVLLRLPAVCRQYWQDSSQVD